MRIDDNHLDATLAASAPPAEVDTRGLAREVRAMSKAARGEVRRRRTPVVAASALSLLLIGGATAAAAGGLFTWTGWASDPDIAYAFTLPSGRSCEIRIDVQTETSAGDGIATPSPLGAQVKSWARTADFDALIDVDQALAGIDPTDGIPTRVKRSGVTILPDPNGPDALMTVLGADGHLDIAPKTATGPTPDDLYAVAINDALSEAIDAKAEELGGGTDWGTDLAAQCEPVR